MLKAPNANNPDTILFLSLFLFSLSKLFVLFK